MKTTAAARRLLDLQAEYAAHAELEATHAEFGTEPERGRDEIAGEYEAELRELLGLGPAVPPVRVFVYGSCVARDVVRVVPEPFELAGYVARQSWVSAFTKAVTAPKLRNKVSPFQTRNVRGDFESNAVERIKRAGDDIDVLLIDIASDRHGVAAYEGGYVSLTPDHRRAFGGIVPGGELLPFGSSEHLRLFTEAVNRGAEELEQAGLLEKALVLNTPFTDVTKTGEPMTTARDSAENINAWYEPYYAAFRNAGFRVIDLPTDLAVADPDHAWGLAQDHYADPAYHWWADQIQAFSRGEEPAAPEVENKPDLLRIVWAFVQLLLIALVVGVLSGAYLAFVPDSAPVAVRAEHVALFGLFVSATGPTLDYASKAVGRTSSSRPFVSGAFVLSGAMITIVGALFALTGT